MYELKKNGQVFTSKSVGTRPSSYKKRIYRAVVSQRLRNTALVHALPPCFFKMNFNVILPTTPRPYIYIYIYIYAHIYIHTHTHTHTRVY